MKILPKPFVLLLGLLVGAGTVRAAAPVVRSINATNVAMGGSTTLQGQAADSDGNLAYAAFYVSGPGISGWYHISDQNISGGSASPSITWTPPQPGNYTFRLDVADVTTTASAQTNFEVYIGQLVLPATTVSNGTNRIVQYGGEIVTATNTTGDNVIVQSGGNLIAWAGGRVVLKPGFHALSGSFFWAAVDHNSNGYSDVEETECHYISGVPDAWLVDHGLNLSVAVSSWPYTAAQLQAAYQGGYDPAKPRGATLIPLTVFTTGS